jgi:hypothetical protein
VHDIQSALDPFQANLDAVDPLRLGREVAVQQGDLGFHGGHATAKVRNAVDEPIQLPVQPSQIDQDQVVRRVAHFQLRLR